MSYTTAQQLLLPESTRKLRKERTVTIAVNSRDRNLTADYYSNNFRWALRRPLKDIKSIELVNGCIPADLYNVNTGWNQFTFGEATNQNWNVTLNPGQYTATQLATELARALNALVGKINTYTVAYSSITKKMTIGATAGTPVAFTFYFQSGTYVDTIDINTAAVDSVNCPARLLGFEMWDYTSASNTLVSATRVDVDYCIKKLYLHINADNSIEFNHLEVGAGRKDCFHIFYMDQLTDGYYCMNKDMYLPVRYSSPAPIARIATLTISIRDEFYRLVDLGQHDFTLIFEIVVLDN